MDEPFGAPAGKLTDLSGAEMKNEFASIPSRSVSDMLQSDRVQPRQVGTGVMRGTQRIVNPDGSYITLGVIPDTTPEEFGIAFFDTDGNLTSKSNGVTDYKYDLDTNKNYYQSGRMPDGTYATVFVKTGFNVEDAFN